ncbi:MAG TPA: hypothetical protein VJR23_10305 [Candidatus Acidoferrales bacterium]|nr:hypothetical protein [Candidatus Acidoferrales bacterium]
MVNDAQIGVAKPKEPRHDPDTQHPVSETRFEHRVLARLNRLGQRVHLWVQAPSNVLNEDRDSIRYLLDEIATQETALRWVAKTARHSQGAVRVKLWLDLEQAISNLENLELRIMDIHSRSRSVVQADARADELDHPIPQPSPARP